MALTIEQIETEALQLPAHSRAHLAQRLLSSLEKLSIQENEQLWAEEAEQRYQQLRNDATQGREAAEVFANIRTTLK